MRELEDPQRCFEKHMQQAVEKYKQGLQRAGLPPNDTLTKAVAQRALEEAKANYIQQVIETQDHNIEVILSEHKRCLRDIKRDGAKLRLLTCPPIAAFFGGMAWYSFNQPSGLAMGIVFTVGALAFMAMLVGGIFDR